MVIRIPSDGFLAIAVVTRFSQNSAGLLSIYTALGEHLSLRCDVLQLPFSLCVVRNVDIVDEVGRYLLEPFGYRCPKSFVDEGVVLK